MNASPAPVRVFVVEDQTMFMEMLCSLLGTLRGVEVVGTATCVVEASMAIPAVDPDVLIVDRYLPDGSGLDLIAALRRKGKQREIVLLSAQTADLGAMLPTLGCGVRIVDKMGTFQQLSQLFRSMATSLVETSSDSMDTGRGDLTPRECEVLRLIGQGLLNKQIADRLGISQRTIETHRKAISRKLHLSGSELVSYAALQSLHH